MMSSKLLIWCFMICSFIPSFAQDLESIGDSSFSIFEKEHLHFNPTLYASDTLSPETGVRRIAAGRILLKKISVPVYERQATVKVRVEVSSKGDPWDKSGSLFLLPSNADISILDFQKDWLKNELVKDSFPGIKPFESKGKYYQPAIELVRFMTPFGVGFFNTHPKGMERKPVYIPHWEQSVIWEQDITHLLSLLEGEVYIGAFIDTWTNEGYEISVDIDCKESKLPCEAKKKQKVIPLLNTTQYVNGQEFYDQLDKTPAKVEFNLDRNIEGAKLYYITTGHGGYAEGDEFNKKRNVIRFDEKVIRDFIPWRDDCASFRRYNPSAGVWTEKTMWKGKEIEERIASSDYSRSNWCPGSDVMPEVIDIGALKKGNHTLEVHVPEATVTVGDLINYWMISAYFVYDEK